MEGSRKNHKKWGHVRDYLICLGIIILFNIAIFHSGLYGFICKPESYAGNVFGRLALLEQIEKESNTLPTAILGDSTIEDGIHAKKLSQLTQKPVANLAMPATGPLVWLHYLRSVDPDRDRFERIVLFITPQDVRTVPHEEGIQSLIAVTPPNIFWDYLNTWNDFGSNLSHYYGSLDRLYAFRRDLRDLLLSPDRLFNVFSNRRDHLEKLSEWPSEQKNVCDVRVNRSGRVIAWGKIGDPEERKVIRKTIVRTRRLNQDPNISGMLEPVESIVRYYEGSPVRILIVSFPFALDHKVETDHPVIDQYMSRVEQLASSPMIDHWDATSLPLFQDCRNFYDYRHLNDRGRQEFTEEFGRVLTRNAF